MTRELGTAQRQEKERAYRDHYSLSTTNIIKNTLVSVHETMWPNNALASCAMKHKDAETGR